MRKLIILFAVASVMQACNNSSSNNTTENTATTESAKPAEANPAASEKLVLDVANSHLTWLGKKVGGQHNGKVGLKEGAAEFSGNAIVSASPIIIDLTTITNDDVTDAEKNTKLVGHLKAADFFDVEKYPTAKFETTQVKNDTITGKLTIKDKTEEVSFPIAVVNENGVAKVSGKVIIDRTKWGLVYGSAKTLSDKMKDKVISDDMELGLSLSFKK